MALDTTRQVGRSLARLMSAMVAGPEGRRDGVERFVTLPDPDVELEALRELQALDAGWDQDRHLPRDVRWID